MDANGTPAAADIAAVPPVSAELVIDWVRTHPLPSGRIVPVCLWGAAGVGKTQLVRGYCRRNQFGFRGYHPAHDTSGADLVGLAMLDEDIGRTVYATPMWLPSKTESHILEQQGVIFIDEINRAPAPVLQGLMEPIGEGEISHSGWKLPPGWMFVCAANPPDDDYQVSELDDAMMNRMVHVPVAFDLARWLAWADGADLSAELMHFTALNTSLINGGKAELPQSLTIQATPRSIEYLSRLYEPKMNRRLLITLARGLVGVEAAALFLAHIDNQEREQPEIEGILSGSVLAGTAKPPTDAVTSEFLLATLMRREPAEDSVVENVADYLLELGRQDPERARSFWERLSIEAPSWQRPLGRAMQAKARG